MTCILIAVRQEVNKLKSSAVVQALALAINIALGGRLLSLGNQYIVGREGRKPSETDSIKSQIPSKASRGKKGHHKKTPSKTAPAIAR